MQKLDNDNTQDECIYCKGKKKVEHYTKRMKVIFIQGWWHNFLIRNCKVLWRYWYNFNR